MRFPLLILLVLLFEPLALAQSSSYPQCSRREKQKLRSLVDYFETELAEARARLEACEGSVRPDHDSFQVLQECGSFLGERNWSSQQIGRFCKDLSRETWACSRRLIERNYGLDQAKGACQQAGLHHECLQETLDANYPLSAAQNFCQNFNQPQYECARSLLKRNFPLHTARETCRDITRAGLECVQIILDQNYPAAVAKSTCSGISRRKLDCHLSLLGRKQNPATVQNLCAGVS